MGCWHAPRGAGFGTEYTSWKMPVTRPEAWSGRIATIEENRGFPECPAASILRFPFADAPLP